MICLFFYVRESQRLSNFKLLPCCTKKILETNYLCCRVCGCETHDNSDNGNQNYKKMKTTNPHFIPVTRNASIAAVPFYFLI